ncbi:MAG: sporulation protein [Clostridia bacterium]|nr:sporulation protein [Clostridia bacterium]
MKRCFWRDALTLSVIAVTFLGFLLYTQPVRDTVGESLRLCAGTLIPSLFPCMVVSAFLVESGVSRVLGRPFDRGMRLLFRLPGECMASLLPGLAAGYPVGARTAIDLYEKGKCSKGEAERLLAFANNCGPAYLLGAVGMGLYSSARVGRILYLSHLLASLCVGILFRFWKGEELLFNILRKEEERGSLAGSLTKSIRDAAMSVLHVTAFVTFFSAAVRVLRESGILLGMAAVMGGPVSFLAGILEMTGGIAELSGQGGGLAAVAFLVGWAGFSVHFQVLSFLGDGKLSTVPYFVGKLLHGMIAAGLTAFLAGFFA